jgi:hypothetical protein
MRTPIEIWGFSFLRHSLIATPLYVPSFLVMPPQTQSCIDAELCLWGITAGYGPAAAPRATANTQFFS